MKTQIRYGTRFGCRFGQPHDMHRLGENKAQIWEKCRICGKSFHWNKTHKGRVDNVKYLIAHVREYAQDIGSTKRVFNKLYHPEKVIIYL